MLQSTALRGEGDLTRAQVREAESCAAIGGMRRPHLAVPRLRTPGTFQAVARPVLDHHLDENPDVLAWVRLLLTGGRLAGTRLPAWLRPRSIPCV